VFFNFICFLLAVIVFSLFTKKNLAYFLLFNLRLVFANLVLINLFDIFVVIFKLIVYD